MHRQAKVGIDEIRIYIADLAAYNEGRLVGEWVDLPADDRELEEIVDRLGHNGQTDIAIHDYEAPFKIDEYDNILELNSLVERLQDFHTPCIVLAAMDQLGIQSSDWDSAFSAAEDAHVVFANDSEQDLAYEYIDSIGSIQDAVGNPSSYFDYESFGRDASMDFEEDEAERHEGMSDQQIGEELVDDIWGGVERMDPKTVERYFDYEAFGRDLAMDYSFYQCPDGTGMWIQFP